MYNVIIIESLYCIIIIFNLLFFFVYSILKVKKGCFILNIRNIVFKVFIIF